MMSQSLMCLNNDAKNFSSGYTTNMLEDNMSLVTPHTLYG